MPKVQMKVQDLLLHLLTISCPSKCSAKTGCDQTSCEKTQQPTSCGPMSDVLFCCGEDEANLQVLRIAMQRKVTVSVNRMPRAKKAAKKTARKTAKRRGSPNP